MMLYLQRGTKSGMMGKVFHLRQECGTSEDSSTYGVGPDSVRHFRKTFGIRRICLKCRKWATREAKETRHGS